MGYKITTLANSSNFPGNPEPTVKIVIGQKGWEQALENWKQGKAPTVSSDWKKGVFAWTEWG
jgi:hypothetical protein